MAIDSQSSLDDDDDVYKCNDNFSKINHKYSIMNDFLRLIFHLKNKILFITQNISKLSRPKLVVTSSQSFFQHSLYLNKGS